MNLNTFDIVRTLRGVILLAVRLNEGLAVGNSKLLAPMPDPSLTGNTFPTNLYKASLRAILFHQIPTVYGADSLLYTALNKTWNEAIAWAESEFPIDHAPTEIRLIAALETQRVHEAQLGEVREELGLRLRGTTFHILMQYDPFYKLQVAAQDVARAIDVIRYGIGVHRLDEDERAHAEERREARKNGCTCWLPPHTWRNPEHRSTGCAMVRGGPLDPEKCTDGSEDSNNEHANHPSQGGEG